MISDYENNGISSGITEICEKRCVVIENASWKERLATLQQCIIFIDEGHYSYVVKSLLRW